MQDLQAELQAERGTCAKQGTAHAAQLKRLAAKHHAELEALRVAYEAQQSAAVADVQAAGAWQLQQLRQACSQALGALAVEVQQLQEQQGELASSTAEAALSARAELAEVHQAANCGLGTLAGELAAAGAVHGAVKMPCHEEVEGHIFAWRLAVGSEACHNSSGSPATAASYRSHICVHVATYLYHPTQMLSCAA